MRNPLSKSKEFVMNMFSQCSTDGIEAATDYVGGRAVLDSDIYDFNIKMAYGGKSEGGAQFIHLELETTDKKVISQDIYFTNKKGENFFVDKTDKKKELPGFTIIKDLGLIIVGKQLQEFTNDEIEQKVVKVYDPEQKKEVNKEVPVITAFLNKPIKIGVLRVKQNKTKSVNGQYVPTDEVIELNEFSKVFHPEQLLTVVEAMNGIEVPDFHTKWLEANKGKVLDKTNKSGQVATSKPTEGSSAPKTSLFGKK